MRAVLIVLAFLPGCDSDTSTRNSGSALYVLTDTETGCQYVRHGSGGLTPRLDSTGKQVCKGPSR